MVVDIPINCCVRLLHLVPILGLFGCEASSLTQKNYLLKKLKVETPDRWF